MRLATQSLIKVTNCGVSIPNSVFTVRMASRKDSYHDAQERVPILAYTVSHVCVCVRRQGHYTDP